MPSELKRSMVASTSWGSSMSQKGCAQMATPPASWMAWTACATGGGSRRRDGGRPPMRNPRGGGGAPKRRPGGDAPPDLIFVELEAGLAQACGHARGALLAIGEELGEPLGELGFGVGDAVAQDVQFAGDGRALVDG